MHRSWLVTLALVACGGGKHATAPIAGTAPPCAKVADHLLDLMSADAKDAPPETIKHVHDVMAERCEKDNWSTDAQQCFLHTADRKDGDRCANMLTDDQKAAIDKAMGGGKETEESPGAAPAAQPAPSPKPKRGGDPCEGGE